MNADHLEQLERSVLALQHRRHINARLHAVLDVGEDLFGDQEVGRRALDSRLESAVKGTPANLLISEEVLAHVKDCVQTGVDVTAVLKGKHGSFKLFEVVGVHAKAPDS